MTCRILFSPLPAAKIEIRQYFLEKNGCEVVGLAPCCQNLLETARTKPDVAKNRAEQCFPAHRGMASAAHVAIRALRPENAARLCRCAAAENASAPLPLAPSAYTGKCIGSATTSCSRDKTRLHQEPTHTSTRNHWSAYDRVCGAQDTAFTPSSSVPSCQPPLQMSVT